MKFSYTFPTLLFLVSLTSCSTQNNSISARQYSKNYESAFVEGFKTLSFCKCLDYGNSGKLNLSAEDASCRYPDYLYGEANIIDSLALAESRRIALDAAGRGKGQVAEGMEGKRIIGQCLEFYSGKELEAFAKSRYEADRKVRK
ncbi:hypothetical protein [Pontibacter ruber]|uniref:Lipoprotein n=1 Tax=Pontibacter ruber TaxID=1343895 RepID=A0ABW5D4H6_9BACT|nr:hypothetical protein [Pontibacter ruber]